ncbi:hypothetical protein DPMN_168841 [Dreissena polymorpha]|uniref:Uncharacterized protein n=1 Tax=Dreissena polymorpha TaxID=45954 RepID=A0A9D4F3F6_DREPO|nr:hypothetical protein DPMN_168841 [Dreissena polymorpha]
MLSSQRGVIISLIYQSDGAGGSKDQGVQLEGCVATDCGKKPSSSTGARLEKLRNVARGVDEEVEGTTHVFHFHKYRTINVASRFWPEEISPCEINLSAVDEAGVVDAIFDIDCDDDFEDDSQIDMTEDKYVVSRHCLAKLLDMLPFKHCSKCGKTVTYKMMTAGCTVIVIWNKYVVPQRNTAL